MGAADTAIDPKKPVSFHKHIRPVLEANCQGCHQPAKDKGGYVMTDFKRLLAPGDSGKVAVEPGKPEASHLLEQITPKNGEAEMPKGKPPLSQPEIDLIRRWIIEGARNDTPANAVAAYDAQHPPIYTRPPVIASLDYSPDGTLLAVAGFHEVLLHRADGSGLAARLVGLSERVQTVRFSPDGKRLAVAAGQPARMGEVQIWDVEKRKLLISTPVTFDTVYGVSWSPDGKFVAFGCSDKTLRAIESASGKLVLQQGSHNDWVLDTVFSTNGSHIISVGRDMSAKLTETATQRFVDNITSITPGALRGGLQSVARHPTRDEVLVGGADGVPQIYRVFRKTVRKIGDNAALVRRFPPMEGRIFSVAYAPDGNAIAAAASLDGHGVVNLYSADFDSTLSTNLVKAFEKEVSGQSAEDKAMIEAYLTNNVRLLASFVISNTGIYAVSFDLTGKTIAAAGGDGQVRLIDVDGKRITKTFPVVVVSKISRPARPATPVNLAVPPPVQTNAVAESLPPGAQITGLDVQPPEVRLQSRNEYAQMTVIARLATGEVADVTRFAKFDAGKRLADISQRGVLTPKADGSGQLKISYGGQTALVPIRIAGFKDPFQADFVRDVNPVLSKLGCNAGTCHGAKDGKAGFKLSLRGYDPLYDVRAFTDDLASRRVTVASPDNSLMLLKATGAVPHEGGQRTTMDSKYYAILRQWIASGANLKTNSVRVAKIELFPRDPVVQEVGAKQQMRIIATFTDGQTRDVITEAIIESGNVDVVATDPAGLVTTLRRGEAPVLARYEGNYAATTVTVMGDRSGFVWKEQPANNKIDELVAAKWRRMKILPSELCSDSDFLRRVYLDLTGLPPSAAEVRLFAADSRETRVKRDELIDRLIGTSEFVDHWANKWADLLQVNRKFLGVEGAQLFRDWIRKEMEANTPYDQFARKILTASGSNKENPAASYYKVLRTPAETMENTTHLFLATRFNCNKCHDHPFERWTQDQYYQTAAFFAQVDLKKDPASGDKTIGGTAVEGAKPLYEIISDRKMGEIKHDRTGRDAPPKFPFMVGAGVVGTNESRRATLATWMTSADNRYFALSYVNRLWGYLMGVGLIDPLDDIRAGNPPSNPELLDYLTREFIDSGFNTRHMLKLITESRTYQLSVTTHRWNADDKINYAHATARRLPAEVLLDAVFRVTGSVEAFPGMKAGMRAAELPDSGIDLPSGFLANLGRPVRESACECERSNDIRLGSIMSLLSGPAVSGAVNDPQNGIAKLVESQKDDREVVNELFVRILNRPAKPGEIDTSLKSMSQIAPEHVRLTNEMAAAEAAWIPVLARKEKEREEAMARAKGALAAYEEEMAPAVAKKSQDRLEKIASAEKALEQYAPAAVTKPAEFETKLSAGDRGTVWQSVEVKDVKSTGATKLEKLKDGSILAKGGESENPEYTVTFETKLTNITGVKLEVLPHESLPAFGPGRMEGNFLLSEVEFDWISSTNTNAKNKPMVAKFGDLKADFVQKDHDLKHVTDGKTEQGKDEGWAIKGGGTGVPHWLALKLEQPVGLADGTKITIQLLHRFQGPYSIGRFKLYLTTAENPLTSGVPSEVADVLKIEAAQRSPDQIQIVKDYVNSHDPDQLKLEQALTVAKKPLPDDPKLKELQGVLARVSESVKIDPALVQFRIDAEASARQVGNTRLTSAQDIAWALINHPAFLFNR